MVRRMEADTRGSSRLAATGSKGVILFNVIIILLTIAIIGASLATFFFSVNLFARHVADGAKAFYLAEAGISYALNTLRNRASVLVTQAQELGPVELGEGSFSVTIDYVRSVIKSTGVVNDVRKSIQLQFRAF